MLILRGSNKTMELRNSLGTFLLPRFSAWSCLKMRDKWCIIQFSSVAQSYPTLATPWTAARQASLSFTNPWSLLKLMSIESVMPSKHLNLCHPLLLPPSIFPTIRVFSNESILWIRWPKYWSFSFSISPSIAYSGLISLRMDWFDLLAEQGTLKSFLQHHSSKASILWCSAFFIVQLSHLYMTTGSRVCIIWFLWCIISSVTQSCPTLCYPMDCSTAGFPVHHQLLEPAQTHVHRVSDAIQPFRPLLSPSPSAFNLSQHQGLFQWVGSSHQVAKVLTFQLCHKFLILQYHHLCRKGLIFPSRIVKLIFLKHLLDQVTLQFEILQWLVCLLNAASVILSLTFKVVKKRSQVQSLPCLFLTLPGEKEHRKLC